MSALYFCQFLCFFFIISPCLFLAGLLNSSCLPPNLCSSWRKLFEELLPHVILRERNKLLSLPTFLSCSLFSYCLFSSILSFASSFSLLGFGSIIQPLLCKGSGCTAAQKPSCLPPPNHNSCPILLLDWQLSCPDNGVGQGERQRTVPRGF